MSTLTKRYKEDIISNKEKETLPNIPSAISSEEEMIRKKTLIACFSRELAFFVSNDKSKETFPNMLKVSDRSRRKVKASVGSYSNLAPIVDSKEAKETLPSIPSAIEDIKVTRGKVKTSVGFYSKQDVIVDDNESKKTPLNIPDAIESARLTRRKAKL